MTGFPEDDIQAVAAALRQSRKYRHICEATLTRTAAWALARHDSTKAATKAAKNKLHQVVGAYMDQLDEGKVAQAFKDVSPSSSRDTIQRACRTVLQLHVSTRERLDYLEDFYKRIFTSIDAPASILDLACGLNPFAFLWMNLPAQCAYTAWDIDHRLVKLINEYSYRLGAPLQAACRDIITAPPTEACDLVLLLKSVPCLEQQKPGAARTVLETLQARHVVVSFPSLSLGGRNRGMKSNYADIAENLFAALPCKRRTWTYPTETIHLLTFG